MYESREMSTVRERIELNPDLPAVPISGSVMHELCRHALVATPEECCGLISGGPGKRFRQVHRIANIMTKMHLSDPVAFSRDAHHAFYMLETEYLKAQQAAEEQGERITAVYHSHVGAGPYLSQEDLAYAEHPLFPFPGAAQIVISVLSERVAGAALFETDSDTGRYGDAGGHLLEVVEG
jgi:proteasome lid subunit RPN8/RPN11